MGLLNWLGKLGSTAGGVAGAGLLGAGLGLAGTIGASIIGQRHDRKMWQLQNAYNSPEGQMARLKAAGLNPNLVYGTGGVVGNTQSQRPTTVVPNIAGVMPDLSGILANSQATMLKIAQAAKANEELELIPEKIKTEIAKQLNISTGSQLNDLLFRKGEALMPYQISLAKQEAENYYPKLVEKLGNEVADQVWKLREYNPAYLESIYQRTDLNEAETALKNQLFDLQDKLGGTNAGTVINLLRLIMLK